MTHNTDEYCTYLAARDLTERLLLVYASESGSGKDYLQEAAVKELDILINRMKES